MPALSPRMRTLMLLTATAVLAACMAYAKLSVDTHKAQLRSLHLAHELQVRLSLSHCPHISFNAHHSATNPETSLRSAWMARSCASARGEGDRAPCKPLLLRTRPPTFLS
jgi:hypothetical protein